MEDFMQVQFSSVAQLYLILCDPMDLSMPGFPSPTPSHPTISSSVILFSSCLQSFPESRVFFLILCHPVLLLSSIFPRIKRFFSIESVLDIRWPKCWNFSISPSNEYIGLISFRIDWFDILVVRAKIGTIKDRNGMHITEAEDIKKRWQECTEELYKKDLNEPDNHHVIILSRARHTGVWSQAGLWKHNYDQS